MTDSKTTDVLIIGAGAAGLSAAVAAHDSGAKVTVIEKGAKLGGTAAISGDSGGAAEFCALLNDSYLCAAIVGSDSRAQACSTSSNNENVCRL